MPTVHIAVLDTLADWEIGYLTAYLNNGQYQIEPGRFEIGTVGLDAEPALTMGGLRVLPDLTIEELDSADSAMLVLPGASTWEQGVGQPFIDKTQEFLAAGVPVAAICGATYGLAAAGLLDARPHTSNDPSYLAGSGYAGAQHYRAEPVVTDGDLITANSTAPVEFAAAVFDRLGSHTPQVLASWLKLFRHQDPAGYFELAGE